MNPDTLNTPIVMYQRWRHLLFLHWETDPEALQKLLPPPLTLDLHQGKAYVGLVPFTMQGIRPKGLPPLRALSNFHETNVRTYVRYEDGVPGVWFFSLDAANWTAVKIARAWFKLPYFYARMSLQKTGDRIEYHTRRLSPPPLPAECSVEYSISGTPAPAPPGTLDEFLVERYLLYTVKNGVLYRGRVCHAPYQIQPASLHSLSESLIAAAGIERFEGPPLICYSPGVDVRVCRLERLGES